MILLEVSRSEQARFAAAFPIDLPPRCLPGSSRVLGLEVGDLFATGENLRQGKPAKQVRATDGVQQKELNIRSKPECH